MRKIALLTTPLLILGLFAASADVMVNSPVTAEVSGESTLTWGIDLESGATGFKNESTADLKVTIVPEASVNSGMMDTDDLYAYIELKDFKWEANKDGAKTTAPSVTTKLIMGAFSIITYSGPTVKVDYVDSQDGDKADGTDEDEFPGADFEDVQTEYKGDGLTVAYELDPVKLSLGVVSEHDWIESKPDPANKDVVDCHSHDTTDGSIIKCANADEGDRNDDNAYAFIGTVNLDIGDNADLEAKVAYAHEYQSHRIQEPRRPRHRRQGHIQRGRHHAAHRVRHRDLRRLRRRYSVGRRRRREVESFRRREEFPQCRHDDASTGRRCVEAIRGAVPQGRRC